jgi:ribonuclease-3
MKEPSYLEETLGLSFHNKDLLRQALAHRSYLNECPGFPLPSNERLEFVGDAVLGFLVAKELYQRFPEDPEGELTARRSALVRRETLARWAQHLQLGDYLLLGKGEEASGGRKRQANLANALEALLGAIFLDQGLEVAHSFLCGFLDRELDELAQRWPEKDPKSAFQELAQRLWQMTPAYRTVAAEGHQHRRQFTVEVLLGGQVMGRGVGSSKQQAEREAALAALETLGQGKADA